MRQGVLASWLVATIVATTTLAGPKVEFDRSAEFAIYRTYSWKAGTPAPDERVQQRIEQAIDEQLEASGLTRLASAGDLIVVTHTSTSRDAPADRDQFAYGGWPGWGASSGQGAPSAEISQLPGGTLIVDLVDAETNKLVWRGVASGTIKRSSEKAEASVQKKIEKLFRNFPPGSQAAGGGSY
jgi:hypothetical protein